MRNRLRAAWLAYRSGMTVNDLHEAKSLLNKQRKHRNQETPKLTRLVPGIHTMIPEDVLREAVAKAKRNLKTP